MPASAADAWRGSLPARSCSTRSARCSTFEPPAPHLRAALRERRGLDVGARRRERGDPGRDRLLPRAPARGPRRRRRCRPAAALRGGDAAALPGVDARRRSTRCWPRCASTPTRTPRPRCARCARAGMRLVVVSNWDVSLHERLHETGLAPLRRRRARLGRGRRGQARRRDLRARARARRARRRRRRWHVGDSPEADVEGAPRRRPARRC